MFFQFSSYEKAAEVEEFFISRMMPNIARTVKQGIERIHINAAWVKSIQNDKDLPRAVKELAYSKYWFTLYATHVSVLCVCAIPCHVCMQCVLCVCSIRRYLIRNYLEFNYLL